MVPAVIVIDSAKLFRPFFESDAAESLLRKGLQQAHIHFRHTPVFVEIEERAPGMIGRFLAEAQPDRTGDDEFEVQLLLVVLSSVAKCLTERGMAGRELRRWADACAAMLANHIQLQAHLGGNARTPHAERLGAGAELALACGTGVTMRPFLQVMLVLASSWAATASDSTVASRWLG